MQSSILLCLAALSGCANAQYVLQALYLNFMDTTVQETNGLCVSGQQSSNQILYTTCGSFASDYNYAEFSFGQALLVSRVEGSCLTFPTSIEPDNITDPNAMILAPCSITNTLQRFGYNSALTPVTNPASFPQLVSSAYFINGILTPVCVRPCLATTTRTCAYSAAYIVTNGLGQCSFSQGSTPINSAITAVNNGIIPGFGTTTSTTSYLATVVTGTVAPSTNFIVDVSTLFVATTTQFGGAVFVTSTSTNQQVFTEATATTDDFTETQTVSAIVFENTTLFFANGVQTTPVEGGGPFATGVFPTTDVVNPFPVVTTTSQFNPFGPVATTTSAFNPFATATSAFNPFATTSMFNPFATSSVFNPFATSSVFNPFARSRPTPAPQPSMNTDAADGGVGVFYKQANEMMRQEEMERNRFVEAEDDMAYPEENAYPESSAEAVNTSHESQFAGTTTGLSTSAIVAILVSSSVLLLLCVCSMAAIGYNWYQKRKNRANKSVGDWDGESVTSDIETVSMPPSAMYSSKKGSLSVNDGESDLTIPGSFVV
ncbi:hypothetical protein SARC_01388 [Sphaeroforma arctica JP610]|uniref:Uncharacterized protein n=1 Tax=Sphaeroforma arctica JP610 TaxID=667725 RepID=A0A0L0GBV8_9EUKA|nr:hypothetical protein SARC_01388 [Sphaeroforma arctica JP610]KNC86480.1 hypothetical protein SARC_01388 [Sphaeroforma arctica JP610]|eukprot:XP_014160382.1 hypothetical protein SARC_01388 [Sphaeroforma arctica JP610]